RAAQVAKSRCESSGNPRFPIPDARFPTKRVPAVVVVRRARTLRRHHARPDRHLRRTRRPEHSALPRLDDSFQNLAALTRLRVSHSNTRHREAELCVECRELLPQLEGALIDEPQAAPLEEWSELHGQ